MDLSVEIVFGLVVVAAIVGCGAMKLFQLVTKASPIVDAACTLSAFAVLGALLGRELLLFALSMPAKAVTLLNVPASWDDSVLVRWAAMLKRMHELKADGVTLLDIQAVLLLALLGFAGMRLVHHAVTVLRVFKVARRNQNLMLKKDAVSPR